MWNRRHVLALGASVSTLPFISSSSFSQASAKEIRLMTWGGSWQDIFRPVAQAYEKDTGTKVEFVVQSGAADGLNKLTAQRANPQVDVWTSIASTVQAATSAGLLAKLDPEKISHLKEMPKGFVSDTGVSIWLSPRGIFYRKPIGKRATKKRQTPAPIPPRLLAHLRRWRDRNGVRDG